MNVLINFDSKRQQFKCRIDDMGSQKMVGYFDTRTEAEIRGEEQLQKMRKERKAKIANKDYSQLSEWNRRAAESRQRIVAKYGAVHAV
jgi:hypothetical protein